MCFQNKRVSINKDELKSTSKAVETVHNLCCNENKGASELVAELSTLYQCIRWAATSLFSGEGRLGLHSKSSENRTVHRYLFIAPLPPFFVVF